MAICGPSGHNQQGPVGLSLVLAGYWSLGFFLIFPRIENDAACEVFRVLLTIIAFGVLISLIGVHITDPGIIPVGIWSTETAAILRGPIAMQFRKANDPISGEEYEQKFCTHCLIWRPARSAHCYTCDRCVARYDHHCPILGACIAQRTYRFFLGVLFFASIGGLILFITSIWWLVAIHPRNNDVWNDWPAYIAVLSLISTLYLGGVSGFLLMHCFLLCQQKTTKEQFGRAGRIQRRCCLISSDAWKEFCQVVMCAPIAKRNIWGRPATKIVHTTAMISHSISALIDLPPDVKVSNADGTPISHPVGAASPAAATPPAVIPPSGQYASSTSGPIRSMGIHESTSPPSIALTVLPASVTLPSSSSSASSSATTASTVATTAGIVVTPPAVSSSSTTHTPSASLITLPAPPQSSTTSEKHHHRDDNDDEDAESRPLATATAPRIWNDPNTASSNNSTTLTGITIMSASNVPLSSSTSTAATTGGAEVVLTPIGGSSSHTNNGNNKTSFASKDADTQHEPLLALDRAAPRDVV